MGIPTVFIDHHHPDLKVDCILTNNRFGSYEAVKHLIDMGHKKIGFLGNIGSSPSYQERWWGFQLALQDAGIPILKDAVRLDIMENEENITSYINELKELPTGWFCTNDTIAFILQNSLYKLGIKVPDDISVCGFDNIQLSALSNPPLTTVNIDKELYGKRAVERLIWRKDQPESPTEEILISTNLVIRKSTKPVQHKMHN